MDEPTLAATATATTAPHTPLPFVADTASLEAKPLSSIEAPPLSSVEAKPPSTEVGCSAKDNPSKRGSQGTVGSLPAWQGKQREAVHAVRGGHNVLITGPAGTGKSALVRFLQQDQQSRGKCVRVCAMTGCAALLLGCQATTLHSWAGVGLCKGSDEDVLRSVYNRPSAVQEWKQTDVLIVDEASMMSAKMFDTLDQIGRRMRNQPHCPWGGLQVVFVADFFQLPPVASAPASGLGKRKTTADKTKDTNVLALVAARAQALDYERSQQFCFQSPQWNDTFAWAHHVVLDVVYRQQDPEFAAVLNQVRCGRLRRATHDMLTGLVGKPKPMDREGWVYTKIVPRRAQARDINQRNLAALPDDAQEFPLEVCRVSSGPSRTGVIPNADQIDAEVDRLTQSVVCGDTLVLKVGAQVMCVVNEVMDGTAQSICNGSQGTVVSFCAVTRCPWVLFANGVKRLMCPHKWESDVYPGIGIVQVPLILCWAITTHKCQGMQLHWAELDCGRDNFEYGQIYVALGRVTSLAGLRLTSFSMDSIRVHPAARAFYDQLETRQRQQQQQHEEEAKADKERFKEPTVPRSDPPLDKEPTVPRSDPPLDKEPTVPRSNPPDGLSFAEQLTSMDDSLVCSAKDTIKKGGLQGTVGSLGTLLEKQSESYKEEEQAFA